MPRTLTSLLVVSALAGAQQPQETKTVKFEGRVVDLHGKPIAGVAVHDGWLGGAWQASDLLREPDARSDTDGHYVLSAADAVLRFTARGFCTAQYQHFARATPESTSNTKVATIALAPAVTLIGRVRSPDGKPIPGARVSSRDLAPSVLHLRDFAMSDEQGIFKLTGVPASPVEITVEAEGRAPVRLLPVDRTSSLDVRMEQAGNCSGTLLSAEGKPTAGQVLLSYEDGDLTAAEASADGAFRFALRPGLRYRLLCGSGTASNYSSVFEADAEGVQLRLPGGAEGSFLEVRCGSAGTGAALAEFTVTVNWQCDPEDHALIYLHGFPQVKGRDGVVSLPVDPSWQPGQGLVHVRVAGHAEQIVALPAKGESGTMQLAFSLDAERVIRGKVVDADGQPVPGALVWPFTRKTRMSSYSGGRPNNATKTGPDGSFTCPGLAAAEYVLNVVHPKYPDAAPVLVSLREGSANDVKITLLPPQRLEVKWANPPKDGDWVLDVMPRPDGPRGEALPRVNLGTGRMRVPVSFGGPLVLPAVPAARVALNMHRLTTTRLAHEIVVSMGLQALKGPTSCELDLSKLETGTIAGRVKTTELAALDHLMVRSGTRWPPGPAALVGRDGSFQIEVMPGKHTLEVVDLLSGYALGKSEPLSVAAGDQVGCDLEVECGVLDVTIGLPQGVTRTAMKFLLLARGKTARGERDLNAIDLANLSGEIRLVLPPGEMQLGFQRVRGALGTAGTTYEETGLVTVDVPAGKVQPFVLKEPPRLTAAEVAGERGR